MTKQLICEGWMDTRRGGIGDIAYPVASYYRQGNKVWFATGSEEVRRDVNESIGGGLQIVESINALELQEHRLANGHVARLPKKLGEGDGWFIEGVFQRSDVENANKRRYPRKIWEKTIVDPNSAQQVSIRERGMIGHLEHPADGKTDGREGAIVIVSARLAEDGTVYGRAEILDTPNGLILQEYTLKKVRWGVSSRGNGSVAENGTVAEDYDLITWDAVMRPSVPGAYPKPVQTNSTSESVPGVGATTEAVDDLNGTAGSDAAAEDIFDDALSTALADDEPQSNGLSEVVAGLRSQLHETVRENTGLRKSLEVVESDLLRARMERDGLSGQLVDAESKLSALEAKLAETQQQLTLATGLLSEMSIPQKDRRVPVAVAEAIAQVGELKPFETQLARCETAEEVASLAESLLPAAMSSRRTGEEAPAVVRSDRGPYMPIGIKVDNTTVTDISVVESAESASPKPLGAKLAQGAVAAMRAGTVSNK